MNQPSWAKEVGIYKHGGDDIYWFECIDKTTSFRRLITIEQMESLSADIDAILKDEHYKEVGNE